MRSLAFAFLMLPIFAFGQIQPNTVFVDSVNGLPAGSGAARSDPTHPFKSIAEAYAAAQAGDSIVLRSGVHALSADILIDKSVTWLGDPGAVVSGNGAQFGFTLTTGGFIARNVTFDGFKGVWLDYLAAKVPVDVERCQFRNGLSGIYNTNTITTQDGCGFTSCRIKNCTFQNLSNAALRLSSSEYGDGVWVQDNQILNVRHRGIQIGSDVAADPYQGRRESIVVTGNVIRGMRNVDDPMQSQSCFGITVYGEFFTIANNVVQNLTRSDGGTDVSAIYTKARYGSITGNTLIDAGQGEGAINVKGRPRDDSTDANHYGYAVTVANNVIRDTGNAPFPSSAGIKLFNEDVLVTGNTIEGCRNGIITGASERCRNNVIRGNVFRNLYRNDGGAIGVNLTANAEGTIVEGNEFLNISSATGTSIGVRCAKLGDFTEVRNNRFRNVKTAVWVGNTDVIGRFVLKDNGFATVALGVDVRAPITGFFANNNTWLGGVTTGFNWVNIPTTLYASGHGFEASGVATIPAGSTSVTVPISLLYPKGRLTAQQVRLTSVGTASSPFVQLVTDKSVTIALAYAPTVPVSVAWQIVPVGGN